MPEFLKVILLGQGVERRGGAGGMARDRVYLSDPCWEGAGGASHFLLQHLA